jgi:spermidine synthase
VSSAPPRPPADPWAPAVALLLGAFLFSGHAALTWQMSWVRQLVSLFGVTWFAITTILTVFMAGIAAGSVVAGRLVDRHRVPPLLVFAALEAFLALYGLAFSTLLGGVETVYLEIAGGGGLSFAAHAALRFAFGALVLAPPTLASGATLPAAAKAFVRDDAGLGRGLAALYGANVLGAAVGAGATTFFTIGLLGYPGTAMVGAWANGIAALLAVVAHRTQRVPAPAPVPAAVRRTWTPAARAVALTYFIVGFGSLSGELLWSRVFSQVGFNPATYTFGLVLVAFLVGHGVGAGVLFGWLVRRFEARRLFAALPVCIGLLMALSVLGLLPRSAAMEPVWLLRQIGVILPVERAWLLVPAVSLPAMASGAMFPLASRLSIRGVSGVGTGVGSLAALSTVGGILGSFLTGFWLMPALGAVHCIFLVAGLNVLAGIGSWVALSDAPTSRRRRAGLGALATAAAVGSLVALVPNHVSLVLFPAEELLAFGEGRNSSTAVARDPEWGNFLLVHGERVKGGGTSVDLATRMLPAPRDVAVIGLGTGSVAAAALRVDEVERVTAIDIDGDLPDFIPWMRGEGMDVFVPPRFRFVENDGRHFLLTTHERYDLLVNDAAIYAWYLELSTLEFNRLARAHLADEGLYAGRLHMWRISEIAFQREIATFLEVFPNAALWRLSDDIGMLVGRNGDLPVDRSLSGEPMPWTLWHDADSLRAIAEGQLLITDAFPLHIPDTFVSEDRYPLLEYTSPRALPEEVIGDHPAPGDGGRPRRGAPPQPGAGGR